MHHINRADLWMERNTSYGYLMRELTAQSSAVPGASTVDPAGDSSSSGSRNQNNWASLRVFETGDAADKEAWDMSVQLLRYTGAHCWKVEREGVLVKQDDNAAATSHPSTTGETTLLV